MALLKYKQIGEIDPDFYKKLAQAESGGRNIKNPQKGASATGMYQFTEGTWKNVVNNLGLNYTLNDRYDPKKQQVVIEQFTKDNERSLFNTLGRKPNNTELYTAHFLGSGGANKFLQELNSNPDGKSQPTEAVLKYNKGVFLDKSGRLRTNREVYNELNRRIDSNGKPETPDTFYNSKDLNYLYEVTPKITNFDDYDQSGIFAVEEEKSPEPIKIDAKQAEAERLLAEKTNELNFIDEMALQNEQTIKQSFNQPQVQNKQIQIAPLDQTFANVSQFVDAPIAQMGGRVTPQSFTQNYIQSGNYIQRLENSGYNNPENVIKQRLANVNTTNTIYQDGKPNILEQVYNKITDTPYSTQGSKYDPNTNTIIIDSQTDESKSNGNTNKNAVKAHEFGHSELSKIPLNRFDSEQLVDRLKTTVKNIHDLSPEENKSDLNTYRYLLQQEGIYDAGKDVFKKEHLNNSKKSFYKDRLLKNYSENDLIWLMNNVAQQNSLSANPTYAQQGGAIRDNIPNLQPKILQDNRNLTPETFLESYLQSPIYKERLQKQGYKNPDMVIDYRLNRLKDVDIYNQTSNDSFLEEAFRKLRGYNDGNIYGSNYSSSNNKLLLNNDEDQRNAKENKFNAGKLNPEYTKAHELSHALISGAELNDRDKSELFNRLQSFQLDEDFRKVDRDVIKNKNYQEVDHDSQPTENKADIDAIRYMMYKNGIYDTRKDGEFTKEHLNKLYKTNDFIKNRLKNNYKDEDLIWLMNNIADNSDIDGVYGQQGGIIKDQKGQIKHPWKVTEIQGNKMTSEGYGQIPLYVVPDKGQPQIIMPNTGEYHFPNATRFTEFPINLQDYLK